MRKVITGLEVIQNDKKFHNKAKGNIAYLCHSASIDSNLQLGIFALKKIFGDRLKKVFGPQHGFVTDVQDNMIETSDFIHPYFKLPIHSLYSDTRSPSEEMLEDIDTVIVDLQDVGTRVYTYIHTLTLLMEECAKKDIDVVVLDRPNPIGGTIVEGNVLDDNFKSFVGRHSIPMRHGLTIGEVALMADKFFNSECNLTVVPMKKWKRSLFFDDCNLPWIPPSPNLPTVDGTFTFAGTVLFEGTNISEGRGTTRSLEIVGHPEIEPFSFHDHLKNEIDNSDLTGFTLRPLKFKPTFQKHQDISCGGFQIHVLDKKKFRPWKLGQFLCREFYKQLGKKFEWSRPPYEYELVKMPFDMINGSDEIRSWVTKNGTLSQLEDIESRNMDDFLAKRKQILIY